MFCQLSVELFVLQTVARNTKAPERIQILLLFTYRYTNSIL